MKIYKDKNLTEEIHSLNLGICEAGETKEFTFYISNDSVANMVELFFSIDNEEVDILQVPKELAPYGIGELVISWSPSITLLEGLSAQLLISGKAIYG